MNHTFQIDRGTAVIGGTRVVRITRNDGASWRAWVDAETGRLSSIGRISDGRKAVYPLARGSANFTFFADLLKSA